MNKKFLAIGNIIFLVMAVIWTTQDNSMEPKIAVGTFVLTLIGLFFSINNEEKTELPPPKMTQKSGNNSKQYQSGGDMTINEK